MADDRTGLTVPTRQGRLRHVVDLKNEAPVRGKAVQHHYILEKQFTRLAAGMRGQVEDLLTA